MNFRSLLNSSSALLSGYDIFISYKRSESKDYTYKLHEQLRSLDFACFIDRTEATSGSALNHSLDGGLQKSKTFVLVGTEGAFESPYVQYEFAEFAKTNRPIIVVNVDHALERDGRLDKEPWKVIRERQLIWTDERAEAIASGLPTPEVYESIQNHFSFTRRNVTRRRWAFAAMLLIVITSIVAGVQTVVARQRLDDIKAETKKAEEDRGEYLRQIGVIKGELETIQTERAEAVTERDNARTELGRLTTDLGTARTELKTAKSDLAEAGRERDAALGDARTARDQEILARNRAREQERIAFSRQLAAQSLGELEDRPALSLLLGARSSQVEPTLESRRSLLQALLRYPNLSAMLHGSRQQANATVSPDGRTVVSVGEDDSLIFWDAGTRARLGSTADKVPNAFVMAFSPDAKTLASGHTDGMVFVWDVASRRKRLEFKAGGMTLGLAFRDNSHLATGASLEEVKFWDVSDPAGAKELAPFRLEQGFEAVSLAFSPDGKQLAAGVGKSLRGPDNQIVLFDVESRRPGARPLKGDGEAPSFKLAFSPVNDSHLLASSDTQGAVALWDTARGERVDNPRHNTLGHAGDSIAFSPDGKFLATGSSSGVSDKGTINLWDITRASEYIVRRESKDFAVYSPGVLSVSFALGGGALITGHDDGTIGFWDVNAPQTLENPLEVRPDIHVANLQLTADGKVMAQRDGAGRIYLRDTAAGAADTLMPQTDVHAVTWMSFDAAGEYLYAFSPGVRTLFIYSVSGRSLAGRQVLAEPAKPESSLVLKKVDGREVLAFAAKDGSIDLWDVTSPREVVRTAAYRETQAPTQLALSDDGKWMATAVAGGAPLLWNLEERAPRPRSLAGPAGDVERLAFGPGGEWLVAVNSANRIVVWKIKGGAVSAQDYGIPLDDGSKPGGVSISPDGTTIAFSYAFGDSLLWDVASHLPLAKLKLRITNGLYFSGGNKLIAVETGRVTKAAYVDVGVKPLRGRACRVANRELTQTEVFQYLGDGETSPTCSDVAASAVRP